MRTATQDNGGGRPGDCALPGQASADRHLAGALLGLDGVEVIDVEPGGDATRVAHVITAGDVPRVCPRCGVPSRRPKETVCTTPRDVLLGQTRLVLRWHKQRWWCENPACGAQTFTEAVPQIGPGRRLTARMRAVMGEAIGEQLLPVSEVARSYGVAWHTAHDAFVALADATLGECHPEDDCPTDDPGSGDGDVIPDAAPDLREQGAHRPRAGPQRPGRASPRPITTGTMRPPGLACRWSVSWGSMTPAAASAGCAATRTPAGGCSWPISGRPGSSISAATPGCSARLPGAPGVM